MTESRTYKLAVAVVSMAAFAAWASPAAAQPDRAEEKPVTRSEFTRFLNDYKQLKADVATLQEENGQLKQQVAELQRENTARRQVDWGAEFETRMSAQRDTIMERVRDEFGPTLDALSPGLTNFTLGGAGVITFQDRQDVDSTFGVGIAPTLLWRPTDRLLLEVEVAFGLTSDDTFVELDYAQVSYLLNDYMTIAGGKFLIPFNTFWERWHPSWINKSATIPLMYERGLIGPTGLGVQVRGGFPIGNMKLNYAAYYVNGPDFENTSFGTAGNLGFENFRDNNNDKSFGGRIGFLPIPELELGYSFLTGRVGDSGSRFDGVDTFIHGIDLSYAREFEAIKGRLDLRAEAIWVDTDRAVFTGPFDPFTFDNKRSGWFVQAAYRPTLSDFTLGDGIELKNTEFVLRFEQVRESGPGPRGADHSRVTLGIDYWIRPNIVWKIAYSHDNVSGDEDENGFFMQFAFGF
ncbi:MAG: hypothetical protein IID58_08640 [Proteobacteria bacterium]|nr:hypothetical protein [Pseudomonadota bacterium]